MGIALMAIGIMMRDGLAILGGFLIGFVWITLLIILTIYIITNGLEISQDVFHTLFPKPVIGPQQ